MEPDGPGCTPLRLRMAPANGPGNAPLARFLVGPLTRGQGPLRSGEDRRAIDGHPSGLLVQPLETVAAAPSVRAPAPPSACEHRFQHALARQRRRCRWTSELSLGPCRSHGRCRLAASADGSNGLPSFRQSVANQANCPYAHERGDEAEYSHGPLGVRISRREFGEPVPLGRAILFLGVFCGLGGSLVYNAIAWALGYPSNRGR